MCQEVRMNLLIFAHRGEARAFLNSEQYQVLKNAPVLDLYQGPENFLLITSEGIEQAMLKTSMCLTYLHTLGHRIDSVVNLGICGAIAQNQNLAIGSIHPIRTIYAYRSKPEFKSFTTDSASAKFDLITLDERLLKQEQCQKLLPLGPLVDREAWAIAYSTKLYFKLPFYCFKLISDNINFETEFCQRIKEQAEQYSIALYQYYREHFENSQSPLGLGRQADLPPELNTLYFTKAQKNLFFSLLDKLALKPNQIVERYNLSELIESKKTPKDKTKILLKKMQKEISPLRFEIKEHLDALAKQANSELAQFQFDPNLEKQEIRASIKFKNEQERSQAIQAVQQFPLEDFSKIFDGQIQDLIASEQNNV